MGMGALSCGGRKAFADGLAERLDGGHHALVLDEHRVHERLLGQRLAAAQMLGQVGRRAVERIKSEVLRYALEGVLAACSLEEPSPILSLTIRLPRVISETLHPSSAVSFASRLLHSGSPV